jgi:hypothetical protein
MTNHRDINSTFKSQNGIKKKTTTKTTPLPPRNPPEKKPNKITPKTKIVLSVNKMPQIFNTNIV